jgi:hypothetical protein
MQLDYSDFEMLSSNIAFEVAMFYEKKICLGL